MAETTAKKEKERFSFFNMIVKLFKSKRSRYTIFSLFIVFATLSMFFIDTQNDIRDMEGGALNFLTNNFVSDFFISIGIGRYDVTASSWLLFGCIMALVITILLGNIIAPKFVEKKVQKNRELFSSEKKVRVFYNIVFYSFLVLIAGVIVLIFYFLGAFEYFNKNTVESSPFISLLTMLGIFLAFLFVILFVAFIIFTIVRLIIYAIRLILGAGKEKKKTEKTEQFIVKAEAETVATETAATEEPVKEPAAEEIIVAAQPAVESEKKTKKKAIETGLRRVVLKGFEAKMHQATKEQIAYYNEIKNHLLSYKRISARKSWACESFNIGRQKAVKIGFRGKTMVAYLALNPADYANTKYYPRDVGNKKKFEETPLMVKIKSERGVKFAKELIDVVCKDLVSKKAFVAEKYKFPYMSDKKLIENKLAKESFVKL